MSKKNKRRVPKGQVGMIASSSQSTSAFRTGSEMPMDYSYVVRDLKRIGTLAGGIFLILLVLSFFLR